MSVLSLGSGTKEDAHSHFSYSTLYCRPIISAVRKENEIKGIKTGKEEIKVFFKNNNKIMPFAAT